MKKLILIVLLLIGGVVSAQSVTGTSGLIHIPSARMLEDGQLVIGAAFIPKPYFTYANRGGYDGVNKRNNPGFNTYITYGILPFVELMFRYTHELNVPVTPKTKYFPDRMFSARVRILNEEKKNPSIVLGFHDFGAIILPFDQRVSGPFGGSINNNFSSSYIVVSKLFRKNFLEFDFSVGYGSDLFKIGTSSFNGIFGGLQINAYDFSLITEYDSQYFHSGIKWRLLNSINLMLGFWDFKKPTFSFNYLF